MTWALLGAFAASGCYGTGSVLQAVAARREAATEGLDPRLLLRLVRSWPYLLGLALDGVGFLLSIVALQTLPLFAVQSIVASFLAVAAVVALLAYSTALQRGTVTQATAPLVVGETVAPALVGVLVLSDVPRPGWGWVAVVGFILAVAGAVALARHGEPAQPDVPLTPPGGSARPARR